MWKEGSSRRRIYLLHSKSFGTDVVDVERELYRFQNRHNVEVVAPPVGTCIRGIIPAGASARLSSIF